MIIKIFSKYQFELILSFSAKIVNSKHDFLFFQHTIKQKIYLQLWQSIFQLVAVLIIRVWFEYFELVVTVIVEVTCQWLIDSWVSHTGGKISIDTHSWECSKCYELQRWGLYNWRLVLSEWSTLTWNKGLNILAAILVWACN